MSTRPDYMKCIFNTNADNQGKGWCGETVEGWAFIDAEHAAQYGRDTQSKTLCPKCVAAIESSLRLGAGAEKEDKSMQTDNHQLQDRISELEAENSKLRSYFLDRKLISGGMVIFGHGGHPKICDLDVMVPACKSGEGIPSAIRAIITEMAMLLDTVNERPEQLGELFEGSLKIRYEKPDGGKTDGNGLHLWPEHSHLLGLGY